MTSHEINIETADSLRTQGKFQEAVSYYREALTNNGKDFLTYLKMSDAILAQRIPSLYPICLACCQKSLLLNADNPTAYLKLGNILKLLGLQTDAAAAIEKALLLNPGLVRARFALLDSLCPVLYEKEEDILSSRSAYALQLEELCESIDLHLPETVEKAALAVGKYPFHLAYQGFNDKVLQHRYGELVCRILAAKYPQWCRPIHPPPRAKGVPLRVGFVSGFFYHHSNWKIRIQGWLDQIDKKRFSLFGYYTGRVHDECTDAAIEHLARWVVEPVNFEKLCAEILADNLHVLIFPEIGMNRMAVRLSALRLAPVQCTSWGHPTTSGLPTIDYFLSSDRMEPPDGADHYSETLIRLPNLSVYYSPPEIEAAVLNRADLGLNADSVLFLCVQNLSKYLPQYDEVFPRIALKTGACQFVFMTGNISKPVADIFRHRLAGAFARHGLDFNNYIVFLPRLDDKSYAGLNKLGDVFLDSIGWSGCNTTLEAIACDLPVVTLPGPLMRGRHSMAFLEMMGLSDTIADSLDHYVEIAARLGSDAHWRKQIRSRVAANKHKLYKDSKCITYLEEFLENTK